MSITVAQEWDIRNEEQIAECVRHSDIVFNLVGRDYETKYVFQGKGIQAQVLMITGIIHFPTFTLLGQNALHEWRPSVVFLDLYMSLT